MALTHWLDSLKGSFRQRGLRRKSRRRWAAKHTSGRAVAGIEVLEDRTLLTAPTVFVDLGVGNVSAFEAGPTAGDFLVYRTGGTTGDLVVNYTLAGTASEGADYAALTPHSVTIPDGIASALVVIDPVDDAIFEGDESVDITLTSGAGYSLGTIRQGSVTIFDNDTAAPSVSVTAFDASATENSFDTGTFRVTRTGSITGDLIVNYSVGGTATPGTGNDYTSLAGMVTIFDGFSFADITVTPLDDSATEFTETVVATLASGAGYTPAAPTQATVSILDDDTAPPLSTITITADDDTAAEPGADSGLFTISRGSDTFGALAVYYAISGTATNGADYLTLGTTATIPDGQTSVSVTVTVMDDSVVESNETVVFTVLPDSNYSLGTPAAATVTITDNDTTVTIQAIDANAAEAGSDPGLFTLTRTGDTTGPLTVSYALSGTAADDDYTEVLSGTVSFAAGSSTAAIGVTPVDDAGAEADETVILTLSGGAGYQIGTPNAATVTIVDDDTTAPTITAPNPTTTADTTPTIVWNGVAGAVTYDLTVTENGVEIVNVTGLTTTQYTLATRVAPKSYTAKVRAVDPTGPGAWSALYNFSLVLPNPPTITGPSSSTSDVTPLATWTPPAEGDSYHMEVYHVELGLKVYDVSGLTGTQHELPSSVVSSLAVVDRYKAYQVFMRTANSEGDYGSFSSPYVFTLNLPNPPTVTGPSTPTPDATPTVTWTGSSNYGSQVQIYDVGLGQLVYDTTGLTGTQHDVTTPLNAGSQYSVHMRTANALGDYGVFSNAYLFDVVLPAAPTVTAPLEYTADTTPTLQWTGVLGGETYDVEVYNFTTGTEVVNQPGLSNTEYTPTTPLAFDTYQVFARAVNATGQVGPWSIPYLFYLVNAKIDIDVDSNNDGTIDPDNTAAGKDDPIENDAGKPGKFILVAANDSDNDGIPDYADGYNRDDMEATDDDDSDHSFSSLILEIPAPVDPAVAKVKFTYDDSDPAALTVPGGVYTPQAGHLRIWTEDADTLRSGASFAAMPLAGHFVPQGTYNASAFGLTAADRDVSLFIEGIAASAAIGDQSLKVELDPDGAGPVGFVTLDVVRTTVINIPDLDVDTNRDTKIDETDESKEDKWSKGPTSRGAIVLPNADKDNPGKAPDNWSHRDWNNDGAINLTDTDWDEDGVADPTNRTVDANNDVNDLGPLWLRKLGIGALPDNLKITLTATKPATEHAYFAPIKAEDRLRVFLPTKVSGNDLIVKAGDNSVIGPEAGATVEFVKTPTGGNQQSYSIFTGDGVVKFGVEGIEFGSLIDLTVTVKIGAATIHTDKVRVRIAPFALLDHTTDVAGGTGKTAFVSDHATIDNGDLITEMTNHFGARLDKAAIDDPWQQDGYEIGYAHAPYGSLPVVLELPRASSRAAKIHKYVRESLLQANVGVNVRITGTPTTYDSGGNIESIPITNKPGYFFYGKDMSTFQTNFFAAQDVNPALSVNTDWLNVGHVDEVVSPAPDGQRVIVADPESAWALLLWAASIDATAVMHRNMNTNGAGGIPVGDVVDTAAGKPGAKLRPYNFTTVMNAANLPDVWSKVTTTMSVSPPESTPAADGGNTGTGALSKGGALIGFFPNNKKRFYEARFTTATDYELWYKEDGAAAWTKDPTAGKTTQDSVFKNAKAFLLKHWWSGAPKAGDKFTFDADPTAKMIEMPVLFGEQPVAFGGKAAAYTTNHVNVIVDGTSVISGEAYGPSVNYDGAGAKDILKEYALSIFQKAGYTAPNIRFADARFYHDRCGSLHCGTNVQRTLPSLKWWEK